VIANEHKTVGAVECGHRRGFGKLRGLVDDRDIERLLAHDARSTGGSRGGDHRGVL